MKDRITREILRFFSAELKEEILNSGGDVLQELIL